MHRYFKRLDLPEMEVLGQRLEEGRVKWQYANNTLVISYTKPEAVRAAEVLDKQTAAALPVANASGEEPECKQQ